MFLNLCIILVEIRIILERYGLGTDVQLVQKFYSGNKFYIYSSLPFDLPAMTCILQGIPGGFGFEIVIVACMHYNRHPLPCKSN